MKHIQKIFLVPALMLLIASCKKEELNLTPPVDLGGEITQNSALDLWLSDSLTVPYNINVKYRWNPWELQLDATLTPPDETKIIPAMSALKRVWIEPYNDETGSDLFIKTYSPKQIKLVGSVQYNPNGSALLGQAEGGNNITFYDINQNYERDEVASIRTIIHTSHHEFAHILHQNVLYPPEFIGVSEKLGLAGYSATWFNISQGDARDNGYFTAYSMAKADEDFVETVSNLLTEGKSRYEEIVASVNPTAQEAFRQKERFVVNYFREVWNIDFYSLQTRVQAALNKQVPVPTPEEAYGSDKIYSTASVNPNDQTILPQKASWMLLYNTSRDSVAAIPGFGLTLDSLAVISIAPDASVLRFYIEQAGNSFAADFLFGVGVSGNVYSYTLQDQNDNGVIIKDAVTPLLNYFSNNQFTFSWYSDPSVSIYARLKFTPVASPGNYFLALLLP